MSLDSIALLQSFTHITLYDTIYITRTNNLQFSSFLVRNTGHWLECGLKVSFNLINLCFELYNLGLLATSVLYYAPLISVNFWNLFLPYTIKLLFQLCDLSLQLLFLNVWLNQLVLQILFYKLLFLLNFNDHLTRLVT